MSSGAFAIDTDHATQVMSSLNTEEENLVSSVTGLENRTEGLKTSWAGSVQVAYEAAKLRWDEGMKQQQEALNALREQLRMNQQAYIANDEDGARTFSGGM
jgi:WXG100 family type VII secretion target